MKTLTSKLIPALALFSFLFCISAIQAQSIDSLCLIESNGVHKLYVAGWNPSTGEYISRVEYEVNNDKISTDLFFIHCSGYTIMTHYDTLISVRQ